MSQFYWQLQANTQQEQGTNDGDEWSCIHLTNDNTNEGTQQQQQPYWWYQQSSAGTDVYSAAAFQGFRASSGDIDSGDARSWQTSITPSSKPTSIFLSQHQQQQPEPIAEENTVAVYDEENEQVLYPSSDIPQSIGFSEPSVISDGGVNIEDKEIIDGKCKDQDAKLELISNNYMEDYAMTNTTNTLLPEEKNQANPAVTVASTTTATESSYSSNYQTIAEAVPPSDIIFVGPISNYDSSGFSVNHVAPSVQSVTPNSQIPPPLASVTNIEYRSIPSSLIVDETAKIQNTAAVEGTQNTQNACNFVFVANSEQPDAAIQLVKEHELVMNSACNELRKVIDEDGSSFLAANDIQETREQNELIQILKVDKENSTAMSTPAERSTDSTAAEDSLSRASEKHRDSKNVRDRYRIIRQQYPEVIKRLDRLRMESHHLDWRPMQKASLLETDGNSYRMLSRRQRNSVTAFDSNEPLLDSRTSSKMNHSNTLPDRMSSEDSCSARNDVYYGEDFINSLRRNRHARSREHDHFLMRGTKSEMDEIGPYKGPALAKYRHMMQHNTTQYGFHSSATHHYYHQSQEYPSGRHSLGPHVGRRIAREAAMMYNNDSNIQSVHHRPRSSFDEPYSKYQQQWNEFAQNSHNRKNDEEEHSLESEEGSSGSDSEVARIHNEQKMARRTSAMRYIAMSFTAPNEFYYFGVIQLPQVSARVHLVIIHKTDLFKERVEYVMRKLPPPPEYFQLPAIEKAAYLFYCVLYRHHYLPVDLFHKKFNREYFKYMCEGDSAEIALWKICKHTQEEYLAKRSINQLKAYELSQRQLFSDEHETIDSRQSERGSRCDCDDSDQLSIDSVAKEPVKFRVPHSFLTFGVGGKAIMLNVQNSINVLEIRDVKSLFGNHKLLLVSNAIESFRGPLIVGSTPTHSVHLYVQRQIELILKSEAYLSNSSDSLESDCLLIWQLLEILVQQQGRVTGPDLSRLLMAAYDVSEQRRYGREKSRLRTPENFIEGSVDSKAYNRFTQLLLGGHIKEALDNAIKDGLYSDAMILARRMCANDPQELEKVEMAFLSHRSELNPVMTLFSVANGQPAPVLTSPPMDETSSWRSHAAIVLANLNTPEALGTVYQLGCVLARRGLHAAADFCFLAVSLLLPGYDPFQPVPISNDMNPDARRHITLIHATLPSEEMNFGFSKGFSIIDLHATEIFHYSIKLANNGATRNSNSSLAYHLCRLDYAEMVSELGNSAVDAFRYCVEIVKDIWDQCHEIDVEQLERLHEFAERLKFVACADANSTAWIPALRSLIDKRQILVEENEIVENSATAIIDHNVENVGLIMGPKALASQIKVEENFAENNGIQMNDFVSATLLGSEKIEWCIGQEAANITTTASTVMIKRQEVENQALENNEYRMQPGQLRRYSNTDASINPSQYSGLLPVLSPSMREGVESSATTHAAVISHSLPQANEQISYEAVQSYYDDGDAYESKGIDDDGMMVTEYVTDSNNTTSHENSPHRSIHRLKENVSNGIATITGSGSQIKGVVQQYSSGNMSPVIKNSEHSFSYQQRSNVIVKNEKAYNEGKIVNDHRHNNSGLFSKLKATIAKAIPSGNEMILPDDKHPSIIWDPQLNRYVGEGIEEQCVNKLPPSVAPSSEKLNGSINNNKVGGLTAARISGGSRYFNPLIETSSSKPAVAASLLPPVPPAAVTFGFIPSMPDDNDNETSTESPFSVPTDPLSKETGTAEHAVSTNQ